MRVISFSEFSVFLEIHHQRDPVSFSRFPHPKMIRMFELIVHVFRLKSCSQSLQSSGLLIFSVVCQELSKCDRCRYLSKWMLIVHTMAPVVLHTIINITMKSIAMGCNCMASRNVIESSVWQSTLEQRQSTPGFTVCVNFTSLCELTLSIIRTIALLVRENSRSLFVYIRELFEQLSRDRSNAHCALHSREHIFSRHRVKSPIWR